MEFQVFLDLLNETLAAAIVIVAASMLLYNLSRSMRNQVARTSGIVLACVTVVYIGDVLLSFDPKASTYAVLLRVQWFGLAFIPAALFHLSDALLATTGLPSRGRRRRAVRLLYVLGAVFMFLAVFTDTLVIPEPFEDRMSLRAAPVFWVYFLYFVLANLIAFFNIHRARGRCLTRSTNRRMGYLEFSVLLPSIGVFPYSVLLNPGDEYSTGALILVNGANLTVILTLLFLSYPLSFFGSEIPDRVVKADLLRFMLLGPATGVWALMVILYSDPATEWFSLPGNMVMPFAVVAVILMWQWSVDIVIPWIEKWLIYNDEDDAQLAKLNTLSERLLTRADLLQLIDAVLESTCDYLQVSRAFIAPLGDQDDRFVQSVGDVGLTVDSLDETLDEMLALFPETMSHIPQQWRDFGIIPLYSRRLGNAGEPLPLIGLMGIEVRERSAHLTPDEDEMLRVFVKRAARILDDLLLQEEVYAALEGLLPQIAMTRGLAAEVEYRPGYAGVPVNGVPKRDQVIEQVHAALRHYWGGPGLASSRLLELSVVRNLMPENEDNAVRALRAALLTAIESQRPEGTPDMKNPEWLLYNILRLRFLEKRKVRETAQRLYMSEANLYRKQNVAIEAVADTLIEMERDS